MDLKKKSKYQVLFMFIYSIMHGSNYIINTHRNGDFFHTKRNYLNKTKT